MLAALFIAMQKPPVDYIATPQAHQPMSFERRLVFDKAFEDKSLPRLKDIISAEKVLSRFRCIGSMRRWNRRFSFGRNATTLLLDKSLIEFDFISTGGRDGRSAGRKLYPFEGFLEVDDGFFDTAFGVYSITTHKATLTYCGPSHPDR